MIIMRLTQTPVGVITILENKGKITNILFEKQDIPKLPEGESDVLNEAKRQLTLYFNGQLKAFDLPVDARGTPFQRRVWERLLEVPYGSTQTYGELATRLGDKKLAQAVGAAVGRNPLAIVNPCHRIVGVKGKLVGFAGGLEVKKTLLDLEKLNLESGAIPGAINN